MASFIAPLKRMRQRGSTVTEFTIDPHCPNCGEVTGEESHLSKGGEFDWTCDRPLVPSDLSPEPPVR